MLVLSRHINESVVIDDGSNRIIVTVVAIRGDKIRLGFSADPAIQIDRHEIYEAKRREREAMDRIGENGP